MSQYIMPYTIIRTGTHVTSPTGIIWMVECCTVHKKVALSQNSYTNKRVQYFLIETIFMNGEAINPFNPLESRNEPHVSAALLLPITFPEGTVET